MGVSARFLRKDVGVSARCFVFRKDVGVSARFAHFSERRGCLCSFLLVFLCSFSARFCSFLSNASFYKWRSKYGGMDNSSMQRMKELEEENQRFKRMYADSKMDVEVLMDALAGKY